MQAYRVLNKVDYRNEITPAMVEDPAGPMTPLVPAAICSLLLGNLQAFIASTKIFSFTFSHHFYNGLAGHCASLQPLTDHNLVDQSFGLGSDITNAGYMVLNELLKNNIIVDVKHMSYNARQSFYRFRANHYPGVPIISSHAAVNGLKMIAGEGMSLHGDNPFYPWEINLYDDDIAEIIASRGLVGILMDQRVNGVKDSGDLRTLWLQFQYIAERAAEAVRVPGVTVWDSICLGTDFDGVIHPVDEFNTYSALNDNNNGSGVDFPGFMLGNINAFLQQPPANFLPQDMLEPGEVLGKICYRNMSEFVKKNFH